MATPKKEAPETPKSPILTELDALVTKAEEAKGNPTPVSDILARVEAVNALVTSQTDPAVTWPLVERLGEALPQVVNALTIVGKLPAVLAPFTEAVDRTQGDALVAAFTNLRAAHVMLTDSDIVEGEALVTRWQASAPATVKSTGTRARKPEGERTFGALGFRVKYACGQCGKVFSTRTDNLNSSRSECVRHGKSAHGALIGEGTTDFDALGRALVLVGMSPTGALSEDGKGSAEQAEGGGWRVTRVAE